MDSFPIKNDVLTIDHSTLLYCYNYIVKIAQSLYEKFYKMLHNIIARPSHPRFNGINQHLKDSFHCIMSIFCKSIVNRIQ